MSTLLQDVTVFCPTSPYHLQTVSILIDEKGIIVAIDPEKIDTNHIQKIIHLKGSYVSIGWIDMRTRIGEPGYESTETIETACNAAAAGGFTEIVALPCTKPIVQRKESVEFIQQRSKNFLTQIYPMAAVTIDSKGEKLTEMYDLHQAGAVAFTDTEAIQNADIVLKTLQYLQHFNGLLINKAEDKHLTQFGQMNEGETNVFLGLKGMPTLAETLMIARDLQLLAYTGGKLHISCISCEASLQLIKAAKEKGLNVTCDVAAHQLIFDETVLTGFDTNYKVNPPFRSQKDVIALREAVKMGIIDAIASDHTPCDTESKALEFDLADFGITGLETLFASLNTFTRIALDDILPKITIKPRQILNLPIPNIAIGEVAQLTVFDTTTEWQYLPENVKSKSNNSPFLNQKLKGKVKLVAHQGKIISYD